MKIHFDKVTGPHLDHIFSWLREPQIIMEFWDNTQMHKDDIVNFAKGRKTPLSYATFFDKHLMLLELKTIE